MRDGAASLRRTWSGAGALCALTAITLIGAFLRLRTLGTDDLWLDEVLTLTYSTAPLADLWLRPADPTPPLYFTLHKLLIGETTSPIHLRSLSAAAGIATIPLVFALGRSLGGVAVGLAAALFLAVNGPHIEYSQEARTYAVFFLIVLGSAWALAEYLRPTEEARHGAGRPYAIFVALSVLAVYAHYVALFWIAAVQAVLLIDLVTGRDRKRRFRHWLAASVWLTLGALPALWMMTFMIGEFVTASSMSPAAALQTLRQITFVRTEAPWLLAVEVVLAATLLVGLLPVLRQRRTAVVVAAFAAFPLFLWAAELIKPVLLFRTALLFVFAPILCWAFAVAWLPRLAGGALAGLVAAGLLVSHLDYERAAPRRFDWAAAAGYLEREVEPGDVVVLCQWFIWPPLRFYLSDDFPDGFVGVWLADRAVRYPAPAEETRPWVRSYHPTTLPLIGPRDVGASQAPGSAAWIVDAHCRPDRREQLDGFLQVLGVEGRPVWQGRNVAIERAVFRK